MQRQALIHNSTSLPRAWNTVSGFVGVTARNNSLGAYGVSPTALGHLGKAHGKMPWSSQKCFLKGAVMVVLKPCSWILRGDQYTVSSLCQDLESGGAPGIAHWPWTTRQALTGNAWAQWAEGCRHFYREKNYVIRSSGPARLGRPRFWWHTLILPRCDVERQGVAKAAFLLSGGTARLPFRI
jgi:hypothetical protein